MKKYIIPTVLGVIVLCLVIFKLLYTQKEVQEKVYKKNFSQEIPVKTETASFQVLVDENSYTGTFAPMKEVMIIPEAQGKIIKLNMQEGQYVNGGEVLVQVDDDLLKYQQQGLEANLNAALADVKRYKTLTNQDAIPGIQLEKAVLQVEICKSQLNTVKKQRSNTLIKAPFSGKIISTNVENGSVISPATPLGMLADYGSLKLIVKVPENAVFKFRIGQEISVYPDIYPAEPIKGKITLIGDKGDATHNYTLQITVPNTNAKPLKAGMIGKITPVHQTTGPVLCINKDAIVGSMQVPRVFIVNKNKAVEKSIRLGISDNSKVQILSGLNEGDAVVISGQINLSDGSNIKISQ